MSHQNIFYDQLLMRNVTKM